MTSRLPPTAYRLPPICCLLLAVCCLAFAAPGLRTADCGLRTAPFPNRTGQTGRTRLTRLLSTAYRLPRAAYSLSPTAYRLSRTGGPVCPPRAGTGACPYAGADSVVRDDYLVNDDQTGGGVHQAAKCGFDAQGNCVVAWEDYRNGDGDVLAQRFTANGTRDGSNFRVCDDGDMWWQGEPAVGVQASGNCLIAWEDRRGGESNVTAQRYVGGIPVDTNYRINDTTGGDKRGTTMTVLPDGRFVVGWEDWRQNNGAIYAQVLDSSGRSVSDNFWVNFTGTWQAYGASIGSDSLGNFALAWEDARAGWDVWAQRYSARAETLGANFEVNSVENRTYNLPSPALAMAPGGEFVVVWDDYRNDTLHPDVYAQRYDTAGQATGPNFRVNDSISGKSFSAPRVAFDRQGNFLVCWNDNRNGSYDICAQAFDPNGQRIGQNSRINTDVGSTDQITPYVAFSPSLEYWVFWTDAREGKAVIYSQRLDSGRAPIGNNFRVNDDSFASQQRVPSIAANDAGRNITIWEDERNGNCDIYCQLADSLGNPLGANQRANTDDVGADHFYSTAAIDAAGKSITAWTDGRNGLDIYAQAFSPTGSRIGSNFKVNDDTAGSHWSPCAAKDSAGDYVIVFMDYRGGGYDIYGQRYDGQNQAVGANFRLNDDSAGSWHQYPSTGMSRHGRFVAAWMEERDGGSIYGQVYDSAGSAVGANFKANDNTGSAYMGYPAVACDSAGNFVVAWEDGRAGNDVDICAQRFDRDGNKLGVNFVVDNAPPRTDQYSPSCAIDPQGRIVILWNDWRAAGFNPEICVQRYYADGSPCSGNAVINDPDLFYYNHHWSMQRSVAASASRLYFSWTDNRRHRGFDTYNKITDWNLLGIAEQPQERSPARRFDLAVLPNPLARQGEARLTIPEREPVQVKLFDVQGRMVQHVFAGNAGPGRLTLKLDVRRLSQGTYFLTAATPEKTVTRKLVLEGAR